MTSYAETLLEAADRLLRRRAGQRGRLSAALVRRSASTTYYAIFHFLIDEATRAMVGANHDLRRRRNVLARVFSHSGLKAALDKASGQHVEPGAADLLRPRGAAAGAVPSPPFARMMARTFSELQLIRHDADYNLNADIGEADARVLIDRASQVLASWQSADSPADRDFKHALALLMLLRGRLRAE